MSDDTGAYAIENIRPGVYQLVFSHIGYILQIKDIIIQRDQHLFVDVNLTLRVHQGMEIHVEAQDNREWRFNLARFERIFIGGTFRARKCKLINPEHLSFSKNEYTGDFLAESDVPLIIENMALGYKIEAVLHEFRWRGGGGFFAYYPQFTDLSADYPEQAKQWQHAREDAYFGSLRHFLYEVSKGKFSSQYDFVMFEVDEKLGGHMTILRNNPVLDSGLKIEKISDDPFLVRWSYDGFLAVRSSIDREYAQSYIKLVSGYIDIDQFGNMSNPREHLVAGAWGEFRMADTLPMDFVYGQ